jgi:hypothetical protein
LVPESIAHPYFDFNGAAVANRGVCCGAIHGVICSSYDKNHIIQEEKRTPANYMEYFSGK